tara:strand:- start:864 stop:3035 length:2172 start_codon:yes stop_codon:yes gene_type:complete
MARTKIQGVQLDITDLAGDGLADNSSGGLKLDLNELTAAAVDVANDSIAIVDANDSNGSKKEAIADLITAVAGDGLSAGSGVLAVGVDDSSIETNSDALRVKASGVTNAMLAGSIVGSKMNNAIFEDLESLGAASADGEFIVATGAGAFAYESGATLRTSIGVGTGDSPQLTAVNVGHASDTTVTRSSAGVLAVEGNVIYHAGGTDIPITDGGTGASSAGAARTALGLAIGSDVQAYDAQLDTVATMAAAAATELAAMADGELEVLDGAVKGQGVASKAVVLDSNGDFEMQDSDKIFFGNDADVSIHWDGDSLEIGADNSGKAITIGHSTSEVTVADNLTVAGNLTVTGTTITNTVEVISTSSGVLFEGGTDDGHEGTLISAVAGADVTYTLPNLTGHIPLLAGAASNANVTAAEFALLDGGSSVGTTAISDGHAILMNHAGTMAHTNVTTLAAYLDDEITNMPNLASAASLATVGTIGSGVWQGTAIASAYLDADTAHLSTTQTFSGAKTFSAAAQFGSTVTVGADDTGFDVIFYGDAASANMTWDASADDLIFNGAARLVVPEGQLVLGSAAVDATAAEIDHLDGIADAAYDQTADSVVFFDATDSKLKYDAANDFAGAVAGDGLRAASGKLKFNQGWNISGSQQLGMANLKYSFNEALQNSDASLNAMVFVNGVLQHSGSTNDYTAAITSVSGSDKMLVTFNSANQSGDLVTATYLYAQS